jgi:hypothetical protein
MMIQVGDMVMIEGSDSPWEVTRVDKMSIDVRDSQMGIIELEDLSFDEVTWILDSSDDDLREEEEE